MRKFSWILALMLALSMAFVGCSSGGDGDGGNGGGGGGGDDSGNVVSVKVAAALVGTWTGFGENDGTLVFTANSVSSPDVPEGDALTWTAAYTFVEALKAQLYMLANYSPSLEFAPDPDGEGGEGLVYLTTDGDSTTSIFGYTIEGSTLKIGDENHIEYDTFEGTKGTIVWRPAITSSTPIKGDDNNFLGDFGIQASDKDNSTIAAIDNGFTIITVNSQYKPINIMAPNAGGNDYYASSGFTACAKDATYTISFKASVPEDKTGQIRFAKDGSGSFDGGQSVTIDETPKTVSFQWTHGNGNVKLDTGTTPNDVLITITDLKVATP